MKGQLEVNKRTEREGEKDERFGKRLGGGGGGKEGRRKVGRTSKGRKRKQVGGVGAKALVR